jgi:hypothetical protein
MIKHFKTFFYPVTLKYSYNQPKEVVITKIEQVLSRKVTFLGDNDITGSFLSEDNFKIEMRSFAYTKGVKYSSTLNCNIIDLQNGTTCIDIKAKPSRALYFLFFTTIILGIAYLNKSIQTGSTSFLLLSFVSLIGGPFFSIMISNIASASLLNRYNMYLHKELIGEDTATNICIELKD